MFNESEVIDEEIWNKFNRNFKEINKDKMIIMSTPSGNNMFYEEFLKSKERNNDEI